MPLLATLTLFVVLIAGMARSETDFERLHAYLFDNYDPTIPPFRSASNDTVEVAFGIAPIYLDFDDYGVLRGRVWERLVFNDHRLTWDKEKFGGISVIRVDPSKIWMPDIVLYNKFNSKDPAHPARHEGQKSNALIYPDGEVLFVPDTSVEALCDDEEIEDIWSVKNCTLKYGSWTYDGFLIGLVFYNNKTYADLEDAFLNLMPVKVLSNTAERTVKHYACCEEPYIDLKFNFQLQKKFRVSDRGIVRSPILYTPTLIQGDVDP